MSDSSGEFSLPKNVLKKPHIQIKRTGSSRAAAAGEEFDGLWAGIGDSKIAEQTKVQRKNWWVAMEKVHGANFAFRSLLNEETNEIEVKCAKRRAFLENSNFFGYQTVFGAHIEAIRALHEKLCSPDGALRHVFNPIPSEKSCSGLTVYGELFGGFYPSSSSEETGKENAEVEAVQKEILYCPEVRFYAFDILVHEDNESEPKLEYFLDYDFCMFLFNKYNIFCAKPLLVGSFQEAINHPVKFQTKIPKRLGLPDLPLGVNEAEGIVVKPFKNLVLADGWGKKERVIFKLKNPKFLEDVSSGKDAIAESKAENLSEYVLGLVNHNRLLSARSKEGSDIPVKALAAKIVEDAIFDIEKSVFSENWRRLNEKEKEKLSVSMLEKAYLLAQPKKK